MKQILPVVNRSARAKMHSYVLQTSWANNATKIDIIKDKSARVIKTEKVSKSVKTESFPQQINLQQYKKAQTQLVRNSLQSMNQPLEEKWKCEKRHLLNGEDSQFYNHAAKVK